MVFNEYYLLVSMLLVFILKNVPAIKDVMEHLKKIHVHVMAGEWSLISINYPISIFH